MFSLSDVRKFKEKLDGKFFFTKLCKQIIIQGNPLPAPGAKEVVPRDL